MSETTQPQPSPELPEQDLDAVSGGAKPSLLPTDPIIEPIICPPPTFPTEPVLLIE